MKAKLFSLIFGLMVILLAPAIITSCTDHKKPDKTETVQQAAHAQTTAYDAVQPISYALVQATVDEPATGEESPLFLIISGLLNVLLLAVSTTFYSDYSKGKGILKKISDAVDDNNLSRGELKDILNSVKKPT